MQARLRNNSTSDNGWEEVSALDEVRSVGSSCFSEDDEIVILKGNASPRILVSTPTLTKEEPIHVSSPITTTTSLEMVIVPSTRLQSKVDDVTVKFANYAPPMPTLEAVKSSVLPVVVGLRESRVSNEIDSTLSPIEKTLLHQITRLSEELEVSKQKNEILEQTIHRDDMGMFQEDDDNTLFFRLGLKTLGFFVLLSVVQRKFLVSGLVSIFGAAVVGGLLTYEQEAMRRRRGE